MSVVSNICELIGKTPMVKLNTQEDLADVFVKLEYFNPGGSVKDRIALQMIEDAEKDGSLQPGSTIIEATSGNTGIGLAMVAAAKGYSAIFVMPDTMSIERRNLLKAYGAELILTPGQLGMKGAIAKVEELVESEGYFLMRQFENPSNPNVHVLTTAREILSQMENQVDAFVAGVGTGGTITGVGTVLREELSNVQIVAVEPKDSPILSGGQPGPHKIMGIGAGFIPPILDILIYDEIIQVTTDQAFETARKIAKEQGILGGISTGANIYAALEVAKRLGKGKKVVTVAPSNGERYLSTALYNFEG